MNIMKAFNKYMFAALAAAVVASPIFTACDEDDDTYIAAEKPTNAQVFFSNELSSTLKLSMLENSFTVTISRAEAADAVSIPLQVTADNTLFTTPTAAEFAAGSKTADLTFGYDPEALGFDNKQQITISVPADAATPYGVSEYTFSVIIPAPWVSLGMATVVDDYVTSFFGVDNVSWQVEIQENQVFPGYYRLVNPYGADYPYNEPGDYDASQDYYIEIHAEDPSKVYIPTVVYGMDWTYGNFIFGSLAGYYIAKGDEASAADYYGTLQDGVITFPVDALLIGMSDYNDGGLYTCNSSGAFKVVLPGYVLADYSVEVAYNGKFFDAADNLYVVAEVTTLGEDADEVRLAVCAAADADALAAAIIAGETEDYVSLTAPGTVNLPMAADAPSGKYSIVAITYAGGEAQEAASTTFKFTSMSGEVPSESWTAYYVGNYTYYQCFEGTDENVVMYGSDDSDIRCKLAPWGNETELVFIWDEEDNVFLEADQDMEFSDSSYGDFFISDLSSDCALAPGNDWATIIAANFAENMTGTEFDPGYVDYDNLQIGFNTVYYTSKGYVMGWGYETYDILAQAGARGGKKAMAPVASFGQPVRHSQIHWLSEPKQLKSVVRTLKAGAKYFAK